MSVLVLRQFPFQYFDPVVNDNLKLRILRDELRSNKINWSPGVMALINSMSHTIGLSMRQQHYQQVHVQTLSTAICERSVEVFVR